MMEQKKCLSHVFDEWKGDREQIDDVNVLLDLKFNMLI